MQRKIKSKINNINSNGQIFEGFIMISKELLLIPGIKKISIMLKDNILFTRDSNGIIRERKSEGDNLI